MLREDIIFDAQAAPPLEDQRLPSDVIMRYRFADHQLSDENSFSFAEPMVRSEVLSNGHGRFGVERDSSTREHAQAHPTTESSGVVASRVDQTSHAH